MSRRTVTTLAVLGLIGCQAERTATPTDPGSAGGPSLDISDGAHGGGNADFFFLPPTVPTNQPELSKGYADLHPTVTIQSCNDVPTPGACPGATLVTTFNPSLTGHAYLSHWKIPVSPTTYYRISVSVGGFDLGHVDIKTAATDAELRGTDPNQFTARKDGTAFDIKFRIESRCSTAPCGEGFVNLADGGDVFLTDHGVVVGGVHIQPGSGSGEVNVSVQRCAGGSLGLDIPVFGSCLTVNTNPEIVGENALDVPGTVFVCDAEVATEVLGDQHDLVTLHRRHGDEVQALPHTSDECSESVGAVSVGGLFRALARREWRAARRQLFGLLAPRPLYARRRLHLGGGGETSEFSDFQFALPASMQIQSGDDQTGPFGSKLPNPLVVLVSDLRGEPVANARVHFATGDGKLSGGVVVTGADGLAQVFWTLPRSGESPFHTTASGFGLAVFGNSGPRSGEGDINDPIQPIQEPFDPCDGECGTSPVTLATGSLTFSAFLPECESCGSAPTALRGTITPGDVQVGPLKPRVASPKARRPTR
jgi:hypothetical protein